MKTEKHIAFVQDGRNYCSLDLMINQGPNIEQFLEDVLKYGSKSATSEQIADSVLNNNETQRALPSSETPPDNFVNR